MDYSKLNKSILADVLAVMALINNPEVAPEVRQLNQEILFREVGQAVYAKVYHMNAFDFEIEHTTGVGIDDRYYGLAKIASGSISTGGKTDLQAQVAAFLDATATMAQRDAVKNARQSGKHPRVTRRMMSETCEWCEQKAGTYENPGPEIFMRHKRCDCEIRTEGYKSRNGLLDNYMKEKK